MLADALRGGFQRAHQRIGLIFLDILWKAVWLVFTGCALLVALLWITSDIRNIGWNDTGAQAANLAVAMALLRAFWKGMGREIFWILIAVAGASSAAWISLEAFFRRRIVRGLSDPLSSPFPLRVFLTTGVIRGLFLLSCAILLPVFYGGAATVTIGTAIGFTFLLTLFDSLIRADAVDLLGTDLFRVSGLLGILMSFESMIAASFVVVLSAGFLNVARALDAVVMLGAAVAVVIVLSLLHSYLLLVRFSAIAIMRQHVGAV